MSGNELFYDKLSGGNKECIRFREIAECRADFLALTLNGQFKGLAQDVQHRPQHFIMGLQDFEIDFVGEPGNH
jgi:hypothetical protein